MARRVPLLVVAVLSLVVGAWLGLARMGWQLSNLGGPIDHGPLMISGFLGTLIAVERAVALGKPWVTNFI